MSKAEVEETLFRDVFQNVLTLYTVLKAQPSQSIRRAELRQGEVTAEAVDFMADVEIKSKRVLTPAQYRLLMINVSNDALENVPKDVQQQLGLMFLRSNLNFDGDYRVLYYKAKNNRLEDRDEPTHFPEEVIEDGA